MFIEHLIRSEFAEWLNTFEDDQLVGSPGRPEQCPIAQYLRTKVTNVPLNKVVVVGAGVACFADDGLYNNVINEERMPSWTKSFVALVDRTITSTLDKKHCLEILDQIGEF